MSSLKHTPSPQPPPKRQQLQRAALEISSLDCLPLELILDIADFLPLENAACVSLCCHQLHNTGAKSFSNMKKVDTAAHPGLRWSF
jgi:hypothetical protein